MTRLFTRPEKIKVLTIKDPSLVTDDDAYSEGFKLAWDHYQDTLDESGLVFVEGQQPMRFVFRTSLSFKESKALQAEQMTVEDGKARINMAYILSECRYALIDIENPLEDCRFLRESDGYVKEQLLADLHSAGILMELWGRLQAHKNGPASELLKKK